MINFAKIMFQVHIANFITAEQNVQFGLRCLQYFACCFWVIGRKFISRGKAGRFYYLPLNLLVNGRVKFFRFAFICVYILGSLLLFGKQLQFSLTFFYLIFQVIYSISGTCYFSLNCVPTVLCSDFLAHIRAFSVVITT